MVRKSRLKNSENGSGVAYRTVDKTIGYDVVARYSKRSITIFINDVLYKIYFAKSR